MYGLIGSMRTAEGRRDELVQILLDGTAAMPGCLSYIVALDPADSTTIWITEVWTDEAAHAASLALPAVQQAIARGRPLIAGFGDRTVTTPVGGHGLASAAAGSAMERSTTGPVEDRVIEVSALLDMPPAQAFAHFTDERLLTSWLTREARVDARQGGRYELFWAPADRDNDSTIGCRITALAANQLLAFEWRGPRQFKQVTNAADPLTHVVVAFIPEGAGTRVRLVHSGWRSSAEWEAAREWQERAWRGAFQQLTQLANHAPTAG